MGHVRRMRPARPRTKSGREEWRHLRDDRFIARFHDHTSRITPHDFRLVRRTGARKRLYENLCCAWRESSVQRRSSCYRFECYIYVQKEKKDLLFEQADRVRRIACTLLSGSRDSRAEVYPPVHLGFKTKLAMFPAPD